MGKGKPRGLNSARKLRVHRRNKYVNLWNIEKENVLFGKGCDFVNVGFDRWCFNDLQWICMRTYDTIPVVGKVSLILSKQWIKRSRTIRTLPNLWRMQISGPIYIELGSIFWKINTFLSKEKNSI